MMMHMTREVFEAYRNSGKPLLVEFWAPWCGYCRRIAPAMKRLGEKMDFLTVGQVNIDDEPVLSDEEQIEIIPTLVIYQNGKALGSIVAPDSGAKIEEFIRETLGR